MIFNSSQISTFAIACVTAFTLFSCHDSDSECGNNSDCAVDELCQNHKCVDRFISDSDSDSDSSSDSSSDSVPSNDSDVDSDSDTDSQPAVPTCTSNADCNDNNPCTVDYCNTSSQPYVCATNNRTDGTSCDDSDPCTGKNTCENGICISSNPPCPSSTPLGGCIRYEAACDPDSEDLCTYETIYLPDNTPCMIFDSCAQGFCSAGECTDVESPCKDPGTPCASPYCESTGPSITDYTCPFSVAPDGQICTEPVDENPCFAGATNPTYTTGYCFETNELSDCYISEDRICFDSSIPNICTAQVCVQDDGSCVDVPEADVSITADCGDVVTISADDFITRDYYLYPLPCLPIDVRGKEIALTLNITAATNVTIDVTDDGGQDISLHHLTDMCDPTTCQSNAYDTLSVTNMAPTDAILVEAGIGTPPDSIELTITCN